MLNYQTDIVYADRDNATYIAKKVQYMWLVDILVQILGEDVKEFLPEDEGIQTVDQKIKLRSYLKKNALYVDKNIDGSLRVYTKPDDKNDWVIIADWKIPQFKLNYDASQIEKDKKWFVEIVINHWSVFNETDEE
jgi:hypothetical protein